MGIRRRIGLVVIALTLLGLACTPGQSWGQTEGRIGTVLVVDGTAEARAANATAWEPLQFRAALFLNDTVRTAADSKVKVLLRDDTIMTLAERSEMQFTEFLLTPQQRRTVVSLALGKLRVVTTRIFGAGSATEVRTANTVAGVRGTTFIVIFVPPDETTVIALDGVVTVRNPNLPQIEPVPANFRTRVTGNTAPGRATAVPPGDRQAAEAGLQATSQVLGEIKTISEQRQTAGPIRGEPSIAAPVTPVASQAPTVIVPPASAQPVQQDTATQLNQLVTRSATVSTATSAEPAKTSGAPVITPDNVQTTSTVQQRKLRLNVSLQR